MRCVVCRKTRDAYSHKPCAFTANFDGGFTYNGECAAATVLTKVMQIGSFLVGVTCLDMIAPIVFICYPWFFRFDFVWFLCSKQIVLTKIDAKNAYLLSQVSVLKPIATFTVGKWKYISGMYKGRCDL